MVHVVGRGTFVVGVVAFAATAPVIFALTEVTEDGLRTGLGFFSSSSVCLGSWEMVPRAGTRKTPLGWMSSVATTWRTVVVRCGLSWQMSGKNFTNTDESPSVDVMSAILTACISTVSFISWL